eukprot:426441-Rhodomonas_salina.1
MGGMPKKSRLVRVRHKNGPKQCAVTTGSILRPDQQQYLSMPQVVSEQTPKVANTLPISAARSTKEVNAN